MGEKEGTLISFPVEIAQIFTFVITPILGDEAALIGTGVALAP